MSRQEKINYLKTHYERQWQAAGYEEWYKLSNERLGRRCVCGKEGTLEHINTCRAFSKRVDNLAIEHLSGLLPNKSR